MSFLFLRAAGFSPCGTPMGVVRDTKCYTAPCKTFIDGAQDNRIIWYFVPDNRPFYTGMHVFHPRIHDAFEATGNEYEKTGMRPNPRRHSRGRDYWHNPGTSVQGDANDFLGLCTAAKYLTADGDRPTCCDNEQNRLVPILLGIGAKLAPPPPTENFKAGLHVAARVIDLAAVPHAAGLALAGGVVDEPISALTAGVEFAAAVPVDASVESLHAGVEVAGVVPSPAIEAPAAGVEFTAAVVTIEDAIEAPAAGAEFAAAVVDASAAIEAPTPGVEFAAAVVDAGPATEAPAASVELAAAVVNVLPAIEAKRAGVEFAAAVLDQTPGGIPGITKAGVEFAAAVLDQTPGGIPEITKAGVEFGASTADPSDGVTPGATCDDAGTMTLGTEYSLSVSPGEDQWLKFPFSASTTYHVKVTVTSGTWPAVAVYTGASCADKTLQFSLNSLATCGTFNVGTAENCYIEILGGFVGGASYTIVADTGACP